MIPVPFLSLNVCVWCGVALDVDVKADTKKTCV